MITVYLSPEVPRWTPTSEADLKLAISGGLLAETHWLDVKREVSAGGGANRELARDLASFAVDGGTLIVGIAESGDTYALAPVQLAGLAERIEQVARTKPDPPIAVTCTEIACADAPTAGYLVVSVAPSGQAPHMVENKYLGRGDKTKHYLSDADVVRLHERRKALERDILDLVDAEIERDPVPMDIRGRAHLFLLAEPLPGRPGMLADVVSGKGWQTRLINLRDAGNAAEVTNGLGLGEFSPDLGAATSQQRRAEGAALASHNMRGHHGDADLREERLIELEVGEDGQVRLFCGRLSDQLHDRNEQVLYDLAAVLLVRRFLAIVADASERSGYLGTWGIGIGATNLKGKRSYEFVKRIADGYRYGEDVYRRSIRASYAQLTQTPGGVTNALVGRLVRALGTDRLFELALSDSK